ncbi:MAG: NdvB protein [Lysobacteraceae bacterium]|nr:MAG: NdvB protein [Xanthomonadaceae bacterium]
MLGPTDGGERFDLYSPTAMPNAAGFLWNRKMMIQATCRGYAVAQFMQPEPAKYAHAPNLQAKSFMQPEQAYYAHHPGRFVYVKDEEAGQLFSVPYEPVRAGSDGFVFSVGKADLRWSVEHLGLRVEWCLTLPTDDVAELWSLKVTELTGRPRRISVTPYFPIGYMSWMNQSGEYRADLGGIVASSVTPYQKVEDYSKNKHFKDKTYFLCERAPDSWEANQEVFEGEGGLHNPSALQQDSLGKGDARYETPAAVVQYKLALAAGETVERRFLFGPAFDDAEIAAMRQRYLSAEAFARTALEYRAYLAEGDGCLRISTPDKELDNFVNHWLPRQVFYHGDVNRLTTDPQTRNYLQDNMGMCYVKPEVARAAILTALGQQEPSGAMPDGILIAEGAELKYINQVPHTDHCVWLPVALQAYLDETADWKLLDEVVQDAGGRRESVAARMGRAMDWLLKERDARGLSFIAQGDWCDPMNMVGYKGRGVSGWLTVAAAYALALWAGLCEQAGDDAAARHFHPQAWAILSGAADAGQRAAMFDEIEAQLYSPYGVTMFAPPYSGMREDVGRVTQKHPGSAENGAVYNHAAIFYIFSLYTIGEGERAYKLLRQMIPGPDMPDYLQRGQLPVFIPNYYRGAHREYPRTAGRSSQLFNTGTVSWAYRCLIEGLCGLKGDAGGLAIAPKLPRGWERMEVERSFRGAQFKVSIRRADVAAVQVWQRGEQLPYARVDVVTPGKTYALDVLVPHDA